MAQDVFSTKEYCTVAQGAVKCITAFHQRLSALQLCTNSNDFMLLENQLGRFNVWSSNMSVLSRGHASLDYRLRDAEDIASLVIRLLRRLEAHVQTFAQNVLRFASQPAAERSLAGQAHHQSDSTTHLRVIADDITVLHKLSNAIRDASSESHHRRAEAFFDLTDDDGNDMDVLFRDGFARKLVETYFPDAEDFLKQRLSSTMALRRRRFMYQRDRYQNSPIESNIQPLAPESAQTVHQSFLETVPQTQVAVSRAASVTRTATTLDAARFRKLAAPSRVSSTRSVQLGGKFEHEFPTIPHSGESKDPVCPYCFMILPDGEMSTVSSWREHVRKDLDAYVCMFENCDKSDELYKHKREWLEHTQQNHRTQWHCRSRAHEPMRFESRALFVEHVQRIHTGPHSDKQLSILADQSAGPARVIFPSCPMCGNVDPNSSMEDHIASHLIYLALKCLPWLDGPDLESFSETALETIKTRSTVAEFSDVTDDVGEVGQLQNYSDLVADLAQESMTSEKLTPERTHPDNVVVLRPGNQQFSDLDSWLANSQSVVTTEPSPQRRPSPDLKQEIDSISEVTVRQPDGKGDNDDDDPRKNIAMEPAVDVNNVSGQSPPIASIQSPTINTNVAQRVFACPYSKYDPIRYSHRNLTEKSYRTCSDHYLQNIPRLKQHLVRIHWRPQHHCLRCYSVFKTAIELHSHMGHPQGCDQRDCPFPEKMDRQQQEDVHKKRPTVPSGEQWYVIYKALFPGSTPPPSPYASQDENLTLAFEGPEATPIGARNFPPIDFDLSLLRYAVPDDHDNNG